MGNMIKAYQFEILCPNVKLMYNLYTIWDVVLTFGDGTTENVFMILSGYSSRILEMRRVPIPEPVPPPTQNTYCLIQVFVYNIYLYATIQI